MELEFARLSNFLDVGCHALADSGNLEQRLDVAGEAGGHLGVPFEGFGGATVGTNAKGIVAVDLHEIGGFAEDGG